MNKTEVLELLNNIQFSVNSDINKEQYYSHLLEPCWLFSNETFTEIGVSDYIEDVDFYGIISFYLTDNVVTDIEIFKYAEDDKYKDEDEILKDFQEIITKYKEKMGLDINLFKTYDEEGEEISWKLENNIWVKYIED